MDDSYFPGRDDFIDANDYHRFLHEGGFPIELEEDFNGIGGIGPYSNLLGAIIGHTYFEYERTGPLRDVHWSRAVTQEQFEKAYKAIALANCQGCLMDSRMDVSWSTSGLKSDVDKAEALRRFLEALHGWFDRRGEPARVIWVQERSKKMGLHTHFQLHVPRELKEDFRRAAPKMLETAMKRSLVTKGPVKTLKMEIRRGSAFVGDVRTQWIKFRYLMKGRTGRQGDVPFKRLGVSRFLDEGAVSAWLVDNRAPRDLKKPSRPKPPLDDRYIRCFNGLDWDEAPEPGPAAKKKKAPQETDFERLIRVLSEADKYS